MSDDETELRDPGFDPDVQALLADPRMWEQAPSGMADQVAGVVRSEASVAPAAADRRSAMPHWARPALLGAAAVVLVLLGGIALFSSVDDAQSRSGFAVVLAPTGRVPSVEGEAEFTATDSGVSIGVDAPSLPPLDGDDFYEGWVHTAEGHAIPAGTFHRGDEVELWAGVDLDDVSEFTITRELAEEPESVEHRSSGDVVLKATIRPQLIEGP